MEQGARPYDVNLQYDPLSATYKPRPNTPLTQQILNIVGSKVGGLECCLGGVIISETDKGTQAVIYVIELNGKKRAFRMNFGDIGYQFAALKLGLPMDDGLDLASEMETIRIPDKYVKDKGEGNIFLE